jgi:hypothetical protein
MNAAAWARSLFALGLGGGVVVTLHAHRHPSAPWWDARVAQSRLRRSDLPVVGTAALTAAVVIRASGHRGAALALTGLGLGASLAATGTGFLEPLPPAGLTRTACAPSS